MRGAILAATLAAMMSSTVAMAQSSGSQHGQFYRSPAEKRGQEVQGSQFYRPPTDRRAKATPEPEPPLSQYYRSSRHHHKRKHVHVS
jgi:hypothetical protein